MMRNYVLINLLITFTNGEVQQPLQDMRQSATYFTENRYGLERINAAPPRRPVRETPGPYNQLFLFMNSFDPAKGDYCLPRCSAL